MSVNRNIIFVKEHLSFSCLKFIIHEIHVKDHPKGGWYRQILAKEGMIDRSLDRWFSHWQNLPIESNVRFTRWSTKEERIYLKERDSFVENCKKNNRIDNINEFYPEIERRTHSSVWDFFESFGYDYQNKKRKNIDEFLILFDNQKE